MSWWWTNQKVLKIRERKRHSDEPIKKCLKSEKENGMVMNQKVFKIRDSKWLGDGTMKKC